VFLALVEAARLGASPRCASSRRTTWTAASTPPRCTGGSSSGGRQIRKGVEQWVPLSQDARRALDRLPTIGGYLFANLHGVPWTRWRARDLLERAEKPAELEPLEGSDFHAYRRKWARERKHLPDADVMAAGGWRDPRWLKSSYQRVDRGRLLSSRQFSSIGSRSGRTSGRQRRASGKPSAWRLPGPDLSQPLGLPAACVGRR
jgi:hypothetical protein